MTRRGVVRAPARRANACGRSRSRQSRPERREGGTHERPEPRGPGRYPGFTRIETPASGATHSISGDCRGERGDAAATRTIPRPTRELRRRHEARAMRAERSRQAVRHGGAVGSMERVTVCHLPCQPNHWRGLAPYSRSYDALGVRLRPHQFHASRPRGIRGRPSLMTPIQRPPEARRHDTSRLILNPGSCRAEMSWPRSDGQYPSHPLHPNTHLSVGPARSVRHLRQGSFGCLGCH